MRATVLETGQNKNVEQLLTHSSSPTPTPRPGQTGGAPLQITQPMGALHHGPHLPYAAVVAACRVEGLGAARLWRGAALIERRGLHLAVPLYLHAGQDVSPPDRPVYAPRQILIYTSHFMCLYPRIRVYALGASSRCI